jgi:hypothetical protein
MGISPVLFNVIIESKRRHNHIDIIHTTYPVSKVLILIYLAGEIAKEEVRGI